MKHATADLAVFGDTCAVRHGELEYAIAVVGCAGPGQDRAIVVPFDRGLMLALADGAGGTSHGAAAAQAVMDAIASNVTSDPLAVLLDVEDPDRHGHGETTAVLVSIRGRDISGASVGDSGAWIIEQDTIVDLTRSQQRKPLVGAGCSPVAFTEKWSPGNTLLVASDGLLRYAKPADIVRIARGDDLEKATSLLVDLVRLPSGHLQDDVSIILCRLV